MIKGQQQNADIVEKCKFSYTLLGVKGLSILATQGHVIGYISSSSIDIVSEVMKTN